jgi:recombination protein RecA
MADGKTLADTVAGFQTQYGAAVASYGAKLAQSDRVPTGLFPFDLAVGGGFPRGTMSIVYGPESSNKTNLCLKAIAQHQQIWPEQTCVFFDIENALDPAWVKALGVDVDKLVVIRPNYAEQAVDMVVKCIEAEDVGLIVLDSLAALISTTEIEASAEKAQVGGNAILVGKLVRKAAHALDQADKEGRSPTLIYINQTRYKVGVMFGDPEIMPGGQAPKFHSQLTVRLWGKSINDPKVSQVLPVSKKVSFIVRKWKVQVVSAAGEFEMVTYPHGEVNDWNQVSGYLRDFGELAKKAKGQGWIMLGEEYPTLQACKERVYGDRLFGLEVRRRIIQRVMAAGTCELKDGI